MNKNRIKHRSNFERAPDGAGYPTPAERERIIERRDRLSRELIHTLLVHQGEERDRQIDRLRRQYGPQDMQAVQQTFSHHSSKHDLLTDQSSTYRYYRQGFARFGGNRPFLTPGERDNLMHEHSMLSISDGFLMHRPGPREKELKDQLLTGWDEWQDITPSSIPPRPADFAAPPPESYAHPAAELLDWGYDLEKHVADYGNNKWRPCVADLTRMALDAGLINGWPGDPASWAPYHALQILGRLQAVQSAGKLLALLNIERDWLSDQLPDVWAQMGPQVEPLLWDYVQDRTRSVEQRSIVLAGLMMLVYAHSERRDSVVAGLIRLLRFSPAEDAEFNGYVIFVLNELNATEAHDVVLEAFEQDKVDATVIGKTDLDILPEWQEDDKWDDQADSEWEEE